MASAFQLYGELKADTKQFEAAMHRAEQELNLTGAAISKQEQKAKDLGKTSAVTARQYEKLTDKVKESRENLTRTAQAFEKGEASAKQMASALTRTARETGTLNSKLKDSGARLDDFASKGRKMFSSFTSKIGLGVGIGNIMTDAARAFGRFAKEGREAFATLDKLVRFTTTLDSSFQNTNTIKQLTKDFRELSTQIPQTAENIAKASFTVKSAYADLSPKELVGFLRELGTAATGSNTDINSHTDNVIALAKAYNVTAKELPKFSAMIASVFGDALASDEEVGVGFNKILTSAKLLNQPLQEVGAAMSAVNSQTTDVATTINNLKNVFDKLGDPKTTQGLKDVFNIEAFDAKGNFKELSVIVNELHKEMADSTPEEWATKLKKAVPDQQARTGFLQLIAGIDTLNARLRDGSDLDAYGNKNKVMLEGASASWEKFTNSLEAQQARIGEILSRIFESSFKQETFGDAFLAAIIEFGTSAGHLLLNAAEAVSKGVVSIETAARGLFVDTAVERENSLKQISEYFQSMREGIDTQRDKDLAGIQNRNKAYWNEVLVSPIATDEQKTKAKAKIKEINEAIKTEVEAKQNISWGSLSVGFDKALSQVPAKATSWGSKIAESYTSAVSSGINSRKNEVQTSAQNLVKLDGSFAQTAGFAIGGYFGGGVATGILRYVGEVASAARSLVQGGIDAATGLLQSNSPSKLTRDELGIPFGQGIVIGILKEKNNVAAAASELVTAGVIGADKRLKQLIAGIKTGKKDKEGIELLRNYLNEIERFNITSKESEAILELTADKYDKLNVSIKDQIIAVAKNLDLLDKTKTAYEGLADIFSTLKDKILPAKTELEKVNAFFSDAKNLTGIQLYADGIGYTTDRLKTLFELLASESSSLESLEKLGAIFGTGRSNGTPGGASIGTDADPSITTDLEPPPRLKELWEDFFSTMQSKLGGWKSSMLSVKATIGETFLDTVAGLGDVFANAAEEWDGTLKGFFSSILTGLKDLVRQVLAELIRVMIIKAVLNIAGGALGSILGGASGGLDGGHSGGGLDGGGHSGASGSFAGAGGGAGAMAFDGGGGLGSIISGSTSTNNNQSYTINLTMPINEGQNQLPAQTGRQIGQQVINEIRKLERQNS